MDRLQITEPDGSMIKDTWIYIQEPDVLVGPLQVFSNWSPHMVSDPGKVWIGPEYFCYDSDPLWNESDAEIARFAIEEVARIGILNPAEVRDSCVFRVPETYPAYFGTYDRFDEIIRTIDRFENLYRRPCRCLCRMCDKLDHITTPRLSWAGNLMHLCTF